MAQWAALTWIKTFIWLPAALFQICCGLPSAVGVGTTTEVGTSSIVTAPLTATKQADYLLNAAQIGFNSGSSTSRGGGLRLLLRIF